MMVDAFNGHLKICQFIIEIVEIEKFRATTDCYTPFHTAAEEGHWTGVLFCV